MLSGKHRFPLARRFPIAPVKILDLSFGILGLCSISQFHSNCNLRPMTSLCLNLNLSIQQTNQILHDHQPQARAFHTLNPV